ncbi:MAG: CBS domain-containing protein [Bacteroidota bacterium]
MMNEEVRSIMSRDVRTVSPNDTIEQVSQLMQYERLQQLPVIDADGHLMGLITSYDLWRCSLTPGCDESKTVSEIMTTHIVKLAPKDKVGTAAELFMDRRFKTLPVVNLRNELKGVVTAFDLIRYSVKKEYPEPILYQEVLA